MKKKLFIFLLLLCSGLIINYTSERINVRNITTDSGFDTSYDDGSSGSSGSSSSSSNDSSRSDFGSSNGSSSFISDLVGVGFFVAIIVVLIFASKEHGKETEKERKILEYYYELEQKPEIQAMLDDACQIFIDVQKAWMNFDYNELRQLVTDELYNMYYNQLQTLSIKGEKNVMCDFNLKYRRLKNIKVLNNNTIYTINLVVSFFDYIVDSNDKVIRGNPDKLVNMEYELEYIKSNDIVDTCPVCGAKIENGITMCSYCHSRIQGVSNKMKLSNKKVLRQW